MSNVVLTIFGMVVTMIAFAAFSVVQLGKAEARLGPPAPDDLPAARPSVQPDEHPQQA